MKIIADENIPFLTECFAPYGEIVPLHGRMISPHDVQDADALLIRSVTKVTQELITGSKLQFVATATAGFDHVDRHALQQQNIAFSHAPGCNATAVVEYVMAALDILSERDGFTLQKRTVGVVGCGQVGGRLYNMLEQLGVEVFGCDPLLEGRSDFNLLDVDTLIARCDVVCIHTPLTVSGPHSTRHLFNAARLMAMRPEGILINAGRGPVIDNEALKLLLPEREDLSIVLDVWEFEPDVDPQLMAQLDIATPHIAGYSYDAKIRGTEMIRDAFLQHFFFEQVGRSPSLIPPATLQRMDFVGAEQPQREAIRAVYDIRRDDMAFRRVMSSDDSQQRKLHFDLLRKTYPKRREFNTLTVGSELEHHQTLSALGFAIAQP